ncbi:MAG: PAS-domain containing protein [Pseudomonadota bacterium]
MTEEIFTAQSTTLFAEYDADGRLVAASPGFLDGEPETAVRGYLERFVEIDGDPSSERRLQAAQDWWSSSTALEGKTATEEWRLLTAHPTAAGGRCLLATDITPAKRRDASENQKSLEILNEALRSLSVAFALFDEDGRLVTCNEAYRDLNAGVSEFVTPGVYWETLLWEAAKRRIARHAVGRERAWVRRILALGEAFEDFEIERADGTLIGVSVRPTSLGGFIVSEDDITQRRAAQELARASEQMLSKILDASPANLCMSRIGGGEILYQSPDCAALFGADASAKDQFARRGDRADFLTELLAAGKVENYSADARNADDVVFPALFSARVIEFKGEEVMVSTVTDLTDQVAAREALREANERLRDAIEALEEGFLLYDADGRLVMANQRYVDMNEPCAGSIRPGTTSREVVRAAVESGHLLDGDRWLKNHDDEREAGSEASEREFEFELSDGSSITSIRRPTREGGFVVSWLDVTEQKRAEQALRRAHERLRDAIESLDEGFALYDASGRLQIWNKRYAELHKSGPTAIEQGVPHRRVVEGEIESGRLGADAEIWARARTIASGEVRRDEFHLGDDLWHAISRNMTSDGGFVITRLDISERKKAEAIEREADERMRQVLDACPIALNMTRADTGEVVFRGGAADALYGPNVHAEQYWVDLEERKAYREILDRAGKVDGLEVTLLRADGSAAPTLLSARLVESKGEQMIVAFMFDMTERLAMERELANQTEMLHQSEKLSALGELLAGVAHELNNPLSVVVGHALMLEEEVADAALERRAKKIGAAAERCSRIVKTFLAMARQRPAKLEDVDVNAVVETALEVAGYGLKSTGAQIDLVLSPDLPPVSADADQLVQVFANLLVNAEHALKSMGAAARVTITTQIAADGREVAATVHDNGPGIPESIRARIFEPFFTTKGVGEGTGVGLAFCHRIVESHEGRIAVGEGPNGGAEFRLSLPTSKDAAAAVEPAPVSVEGRLAKALVVDDEEDVAELLAQILSGAGFVVETAGSAEEALKRLPGGFSLIVSDINMPGLGGRAFLQAIRENWPDLEGRLGFVTGDTMSRGVGDFLRGAGRPYLEKPVTPAEVRRLAAELTEAPQAASI